MKVCLAEINNKPVLLELKDGVAYLDGEAEPIKNLADADLAEYQKELDALPQSQDPGYVALVNAVRCDFISKLLQKAVGDDCVDKLSHILDHAHYEVQKYLGEGGGDTAQ